jgi:hypothetical protein
MDEFERKALEDIERFGCAVIHVAAEGVLPPFSYSVGISKSASAPEVNIVGLKKPIAHSIVNEYNRRVLTGEVLSPGALYAGFIEGFELRAEMVDHSFYEEYFGWNLWLYRGSGFQVLQLVYPNTAGVWPWEAEADEWFRTWQPILRSTRH